MTAARIDTVLLDLGNVLAFHDNDALFAAFAQRSGRSSDAVARAWEPLWLPLNVGSMRGDQIRRVLCGAIGADLSPDEFFALWNCHFRIHGCTLDGNSV